MFKTYTNSIEVIQAAVVLFDVEVTAQYIISTEKNQIAENRKTLFISIQTENIEKHSLLIDYTCAVLPMIKEFSNGAVKSCRCS